ncbi:hypothetical protein TIFTF001_005377 [Ficus carica]|uniref:inositol-pentakisphosphate 2-kinase n=1 Tax=Ficus carica TaxID=3494 RepID=A0AA87ZNK7_FICCA|nr:hypothetical protein TIFTF001_005377 [Ficus carica]
MEVNLEQKDAVDWAYRGEGAANLVLAYIGSSPAFIGKVLRVQKAAREELDRTKSRTALTVHERLVWKDTDSLVSSANKEHACQLFVQHVISPLLGSKYVDAGIRIPVSTEFLETIETNVIHQRPVWRVDAAKVDTHCDSVLLLSDHSLFPSGEGNAIKRSVPRYRMHQALKLHEGEISAYSKYDPLDLFSGSKDRINKAIKDLFSSPQNNFRVFLDGSLIFGALGASADSTNVATQEAFEEALKGVIRGDVGLRTEFFLQLIAETIYKSGVMDRLLKVQKLDDIDIEGAIHAYYNIVSEPCMLCFIDLDLKSLGKMEEYYEKDKKIVSCYTRMVEAKQEADKASSLEYNAEFPSWVWRTEFLCGTSTTVIKSIFGEHITEGSLSLQQPFFYPGVQPIWKAVQCYRCLGRILISFYSEQVIWIQRTLGNAICSTLGSSTVTRCLSLPLPLSSLLISHLCKTSLSFDGLSEGKAIKRSVPRYRVHQALKLHEGEISAYSEYDPLDLFSGSKDRINKAIKDLFSPRNNFRVFLDGSLIFGALGASADSTNIVTQEAFEEALKGVIRGDGGLRTESFRRLIAETIYKSGVMDRLLKVQKLDDIDIEGAIHAYYNIVSEPCTLCIIDLDLKSLGKMEEYYEKDKKIVSCYTRMGEAKQEADKAKSLEVYENAF